jgi:predicted nucleotidyltransferase
MQAVELPIPHDRDRFAGWCRRWKVRELAAFGSMLRPDFSPTSDVDLLVTFEPDAEWSLIEHELMRDELEALLSRDVDLVSREGIERSANWIRRQMILETARPLDVPR